MAGIKELSLEVPGKVSIGEIGWVVLSHEVHIGLDPAPPIVPEPRTPKAGHRIHPPVHEDAQLGLVIPAGEGPGVQGLPGGLVLREDSREGNNKKDKGHTGPRRRHSQTATTESRDLILGKRCTRH